MMKAVQRSTAAHLAVPFGMSGSARFPRFNIDEEDERDTTGGKASQRECFIPFILSINVGKGWVQRVKHAGE